MKSYTEINETLLTIESALKSIGDYNEYLELKPAIIDALESIREVLAFEQDESRKEVLKLNELVKALL